MKQKNVNYIEIYRGIESVLIQSNISAGFVTSKKKKGLKIKHGVWCGSDGGTYSGTPMFSGNQEEARSFSGQDERYT